MSMDLTGITNVNEYYTQHFLAEGFEEAIKDTIARWRAGGSRTPWSSLKALARQYYVAHDHYERGRFTYQILTELESLATSFLEALGYPTAKPEQISINEGLEVPVHLEVRKASGAPQLWAVLTAARAQEGEESSILEEHSFLATTYENEFAAVDKGIFTALTNEELISKIFFAAAEPPRFLLFIGLRQIAFIDRQKWNGKRYLVFELEDIFRRREDSTFQAMAALLHRESLCPAEGKALVDELEEGSQRNAASVSTDLKYALREAIELLGNEVLYDLRHRQGSNLQAHPVDAGDLTLQCLRYMYRMLFLLFIESRTELGYAPIKEQVYHTGYSLESLRDIADGINADTEEVGEGYYLYESLSKLYGLIYDGYPQEEAQYQKFNSADSKHDYFVIHPLKAHIFDPEYTPLLTHAKIRNSVMLKIIRLMSLTRAQNGHGRRGRISYGNLGINQLGSVYEALLSYRGFIAQQDLYEVKRSQTNPDELEVGYFVTAEEVAQYTEEERVYTEDEAGHRQLKIYPKGSFVYRLAGREREKSASYYTPECLTKCLVKYALKELLAGKNAEEILHLTVCEPAMGSAAFLNEAINQLAEAYLDRKQKETGNYIAADERSEELQRVKMFIADRNVYGVDLNPTAVELAEVSLWLNTIYTGGYVPWFGTQLVNGNSLMGARRQCYRVERLTATAVGQRWYEMPPERVPLGKKRQSKKQIYHFLLGDPGMVSYTDRVIKDLVPEQVKACKVWNRKFIAPYKAEEIENLLLLSETIDKLWEQQVQNRQRLEKATADHFKVWGYEDSTADSHTSIRQKDKILHEMYKSEQQRNAGPYARLKFAMDYWCALWLWPLDKAELLPTRAEFIFELFLLLGGTVDAYGKAVEARTCEPSLFTREQMQEAGERLSEEEELLAQFTNTFGIDAIVDIPALRQKLPRLAVVEQIAEQNHFLHWELEFADVFAQRGGFDLIVGNPPWIKVEWEEKGILADKNPLFVIRSLSATQTTVARSKALTDKETKDAYMAEYTGTVGQQNFLNATQNYELLAGMKANLYKCFLPQAMAFAQAKGVFAFLHPDGVFNDPNGGKLREALYPRLKYCFQFMNQLKIFTDVHANVTFYTNIYSNRKSSSFDLICNLYAVGAIDESYSGAHTTLEGIKDEHNAWSTKGHRQRILHIGREELQLFATLFDDGANYNGTKLASIHAQPYLNVLKQLSQAKKVKDLSHAYMVSDMLNETNSQNAGIIKRSVHFPQKALHAIYSGPNIFVGCPLFQTARRSVRSSSDYDLVDLTILPEAYYPRCVYDIGTSEHDFVGCGKTTLWDSKYMEEYRLAMREMLNLTQERTLISAIIQPNMSHIHAMTSIAFKNKITLILFAGMSVSLLLDFYVKVVGRTHISGSSTENLPLLGSSFLAPEIIARVLLLNCLTVDYATLWEQGECGTIATWTKKDCRLDEATFDRLYSKWEWASPLRSDYARRQALVELDVLVAMALGISLEDLCYIYRAQFPVLLSYEQDTWYDARGRIAFSKKNRGDLSYKRAEFERIKDAAAGEKFYRTITDDTLPEGPVERTIEYVAPFDRCDREQDYSVAWRFFQEKYEE